MRDESGAMMKNAHIIGSLRRILKLLYNKIKPVFVFDGATPALKMQTVRNRRKIRERQEVNLKKQAERILMARLKQHAIESHKKKSVSVAQKKEEEKVKKRSRNIPKGQYADGFNPLPSSGACAVGEEEEEEEEEDVWEEDAGSLSASIQTSAQMVPVYRPDTILEHEGEGEEEEEEVQWEAGYSHLQNKPLKSLSDDEDNDDRDENDDMSLTYDVPELFTDLTTMGDSAGSVGGEGKEEKQESVDIEVLAALPPHMRRKMIEQAR